MGEHSEIAWTDATFNTHWGCQRVSPACEHCYAETFAARVGHGKRLPMIWGPGSERRMFADAHWNEPRKWNAKAAKEGRRLRVFSNSMADIFEDRRDLDPVRERFFALVEETPSLDWLILTKRADKIAALSPKRWMGDVVDEAYTGTWPRNAWIGCTVEDQRRAEDRIPWLLEIPASVRFLSMEPLLEAVDLENVRPYYLPAERHPYDPVVLIDALRGHVKGPDDVLRHRIDWVIVGGESGAGARPFDLGWARSIVAKCQAAGVACFVKQLGAAASDPVNGIAGAALNVPDAAQALVSKRLKDRKGGDWSEWPEVLRVREFPEVSTPAR